MSNPSPCSDNFGEGPTPYDLPIPLALKEEWKRLATRRHFLSMGGQVLGAAALASLLGKSAGASEAAAPAAAPVPGMVPAPHFPATAKPGLAGDPTIGTRAVILKRRQLRQ